MIDSNVRLLGDDLGVGIPSGGRGEIGLVSPTPLIVVSAVGVPFGDVVLVQV